MGRNRRTAFHLPEPLRLPFEISGRGISTGASRLSPEHFRELASRPRNHL